MQYKVIKEGSGLSPNDTSKITVRYTGYLMNGEVFDNYYIKGKPGIFILNKLMPAWVEAIKLMKPGANWIIYVPSRLAYGEKGAGKKIKPNDILIYDIQLISFE